MTHETYRAIARTVTAALIEEYGTDIDALTISEYVGSELPGLEYDAATRIENLIEGYLKVAAVHVSFQEYRVKDDGTLYTEEELRAREKGFGEILPW